MMKPIRGAEIYCISRSKGNGEEVQVPPLAFPFNN